MVDVKKKNPQLRKRLARSRREVGGNATVEKVFEKGMSLRKIFG